MFRFELCYKQISLLFLQFVWKRKWLSVSVGFLYSINQWKVLARNYIYINFNRTQFLHSISWKALFLDIQPENDTFCTVLFTVIILSPVLSVTPWTWAYRTQFCIIPLSIVMHDAEVTLFISTCLLKWFIYKHPSASCWINQCNYSPVHLLHL